MNSQLPDISTTQLYLKEMCQGKTMDISAAEGNTFWNSIWSSNKSSEMQDTDPTVN